MLVKPRRLWIVLAACSAVAACSSPHQEEPVPTAKPSSTLVTVAPSDGFFLPGGGGDGLPVTLDEWVTRLPQPVTLSPTGHGEVRLGTVLAVVDAQQNFSIECQLRGDNGGALSQGSLDFLKGCVTAAIPAGDAAAAPTAAWLRGYLVPVAERRPTVAWECPKMQVRVILDHSTADVEIKPGALKPGACQQIDQ
ncbi:hypothetical protein ACQP00_37890 [Dactylosporangium sp. CS-047395]|uniref:hypothetical protein n=1 Tax=Dactylosporangium sp. CS-047395 TaxID=3239936 RepID=UPI003D906A94